MTKTEFLKRAKQKYKDQVEKSWVSEMNFIFNDKLVLRVWFDTKLQTDEKLGETGYMHRWCTVETL